MATSILLAGQARQSTMGVKGHMYIEARVSGYVLDRYSRASMSLFVQITPVASVVLSLLKWFTNAYSFLSCIGPRSLEFVETHQMKELWPNIHTLSDLQDSLEIYVTNIMCTLETGIISSSLSLKFNNMN